MTKDTHTDNEEPKTGYTCSTCGFKISKFDEPLEHGIGFDCGNPKTPTPQAAVQGDAVVEWLTELGFEFHDDPDEPFWMKLEYTEHNGFTVKVTPHTAAYFYQQIKPHSALEAAPTKSSGEMEEDLFGNYCTIEMFRYNSPNEHYQHKIIGKFKSNAWVEVPVKGNSSLVLHDSHEEVINVICCGVNEEKIYRVRLADVSNIHRHTTQTTKLQAEAEQDFQHVDQMISDYIQSTWPDGNVLRASEAKPINWEPLVRQIRQYVTGKYGHGKRLESMIGKADAIIAKLDKAEHLEREHKIGEDGE